MRKTIYYTAVLISLLIVSSCKKQLEPQRDNRLTGDQVLNNPVYAEGILLNAYDALPGSYSLDEVATDDAVTNNRGSNYTRMATGEWKSTFNPMSTWNNAYEQLYYINMFLETYEQVEWSWENETVNQNYLKRFKGEAHGLRAWYEFQLLQAHSGISTDNRLLGFPIVEKVLTVADDLALPRGTFEQCLAHILSDCDIAIENLPDKYETTGDNAYDEVFGSTFTNRINGFAVRALRARVNLHAASPAFTEGLSGEDVRLRWEEAAKSAGELLEEIGGVSGLSPTAITFYIHGVPLSFDEDIIWRNAYVTNRSIENNNYPPSLFGQGRTNPSQNLVDAFPMANGYPIDDPASAYDPANPYVGRDSRLTEYIVYNGNLLRKTFPINTAVDGTKDGINASTESTRTGYYLKKFMHPNVNNDPNFATTAVHFYTYARYTEVFLIYAEAANEAWGPDADPFAYGFTARDVIAAIRNRAQITQPDAYLNSLSTADGMRELIRNERRLELCFEGFRFWDLRRWKAPINEAANGVFITGTETLSYDYQLIEERAYDPYMIYGPIPYNETLIYDLKQNMGW